VVERGDIFPALEGACPSFRDYWNEIGSIYRVRSACDAPFADALWEFARHLLELYQDGQVAEYPAVAHAVRRLYEDGDAEVKTAIVELLEATRADADWNGMEPLFFVGATADILGHLAHADASRVSE
jgi:hypothetical protein